LGIFTTTDCFFGTASCLTVFTTTGFFSSYSSFSDSWSPRRLKTDLPAAFLGTVADGFFTLSALLANFAVVFFVATKSCVDTLLVLVSLETLLLLLLLLLATLRLDGSGLESADLICMGLRLSGMFFCCLTWNQKRNEDDEKGTGYR
jgi:hypothetical protein